MAKEKRACRQSYGSGFDSQNQEIIKIAENSKLHPAQLAFLTKHNENFSNFHKESKNDFSTDSYQLSCDEMIELYPISNLSSWGSVYKMLHVGTLKTFYIRVKY